MLQLLHGLPLAIAQAGAYLQESGVGLGTYLRFYEQQWDDLMKVGSEFDAPLQDYPDRSVWTTWAISYQAIRHKHEHTANLLLLWSFLDNKDLWHGLFAEACESSSIAKSMLSAWIGEIASSEVAFRRAMQLLRNYSLVEAVEATESYATHPVVHRWAYHYRGKHSEQKLRRLAVVAVGWAVPDESASDWPALRRRLLPHAQACSLHIASSQLVQLFSRNGSHGADSNDVKEREVILGGAHLLGLLYKDQGRLAEAEKIYQLALEGYKVAFGPKYKSTLGIFNNLGLLYKEQGKLAEAEKMYKWALEGIEEALEPKHTLTLDTVNNLGVLYKEQGKLVEAEKMYKWALEGKEEALGPKHTSTLDTVNNLGVLYTDQGRLAEAEKAYKRALQGYKDALGDAQVRQYLPALDTLQNLGTLYIEQGKHAKAQEMYSSALAGLQSVLGQSHERCQKLQAWIHELATPQASTVDRVEPSAVEDAPKPELQQEKKAPKRRFRAYMKKILR